jgi:quinol monooxygenase YgiN
MIYELAEIIVKDGHADAFAAAVDEARPLFLESQGCHGIRLTRSIEHPQRFRLMVEWETVDDHMIGFRNSDAFIEWRRLVQPYFSGPPKVEHLEMIVGY